MNVDDPSNFGDWHSIRNVKLNGWESEEFERNKAIAITALDSSLSREENFRKECSFTTEAELALERLLFPERGWKNMAQDARSNDYIHLELPKLASQMLLSHAYIQRVKSGKVLNVQNKTACPMITVLSGQCVGYYSQVGVDCDVPENIHAADFERSFGKQQMVLNPGDIFGCEMLCHRASSSMTLIAKTDVVAIRIDDKVLSIAVQHWKKMETVTVTEFRQLLENNAVEAMRRISSVLQMQCLLGTSEMFAKKPKVSLKRSFSGCLLTSVPAGVEMEQYLIEKLKNSIDEFTPVSTQDCCITNEHNIGGIVILSGSVIATDEGSFSSAMDASAILKHSVSILGPSSIIELKNPILKSKSINDKDIVIISREVCDVLLVHQDQMTAAAFYPTTAHCETLEIEKSSSIARRVIAIDAAGKHASTAPFCTVGEIVALCRSESQRQLVETSNHLMQVLLDQEYSEVMEKILKSHLSALAFSNNEAIKALAATVLVTIPMPNKVHQSHTKKIFQKVITEDDLQTFCFVILTGTCVSQQTFFATSCGMRNDPVAEFFSSMVNVPQNGCPKNLKSQDIFFIKNLSTLQQLSHDFLAIAMPIRDIDTWADHFMSNWYFKTNTIKIPESRYLLAFNLDSNRYVGNSALHKDRMLGEKQNVGKRSEKVMSFAEATKTSKLKRATAAHSDFFDDLRIRNERSSRLKLRRKLKQLVKLEDVCKRILTDDDFLMIQWSNIDINSSGAATLSEMQNWLAIQFHEHFKSPKAIKVAFHDTLKHYRAITEGRIQDHHFAYFIQKFLDFMPAAVVFEELDLDQNQKFSLSEFSFGINKLGLKLNEMQLGSDFQEMLDASGTEMTFSHFCHWFHKRKIKQFLFVDDKKVQSGYLEISEPGEEPKLHDEAARLRSSADVQIDMCTILQLHPQFQLIPDRILLEYPLEVQKVTKGSVILSGCKLTATRQLIFVIEGVVASMLPDSSCDSISLFTGSTINHATSSPWHKTREVRAYYCGSESIGNSNFFQGVGDGLEYVAITDAVVMILKWQNVDLQWQQTMLLDLHTQNCSFQYFLWSKNSKQRSNYQQMQLLSSILSKQCESTISKDALALLCCNSQLYEKSSSGIENTATYRQNAAERKPQTREDTNTNGLELPDEGETFVKSDCWQREDREQQKSHNQLETTEVIFKLQKLEHGHEERILDSFEFDSNAQTENSEFAMAFIVTGPAYITIQGSGLTILTNSKQSTDASNIRRQTLVDTRTDMKRSKRWHILPGYCAVVVSEQFESLCRGRLNVSKDKIVTTMFGHCSKRQLCNQQLLSATKLNNATTGSVATVNSEAQWNLVELCCSHFLDTVSFCYSKHKCFSSNSVANLAVSHTGSRSLKYFMGEKLWNVGNEGIFIVKRGHLRVMFSFGEIQLKAESRNSGLSMSKHTTELLCLGPMSIFGEIGSSETSVVNGQIFIDCADVECELIFFPQQVTSYLSLKCQSSLKDLLRSRNEMLKHSMMTHKDILHFGGFQKERMYIMNLAENESKSIQFIRDPKRYSSIQNDDSEPTSIAEISALRHFASSKYSLIQNSCFQSLNENVKNCSANMASFYKSASRQEQYDEELELEKELFEEKLKSLKILPLNSAPKLKRIIMKKKESLKERLILSPIAASENGHIKGDSNDKINLKYKSETQKRVDKKILSLKSDELAMESFKLRISKIIQSLPKNNDIEERNKLDAKNATAEARALLIHRNAAITMQRCEKAKTQKKNLESSFKEITAKKVEEDQIRIQNYIIAAENRLQQKNLSNFQTEILPIVAIIARFRCFIKILQNQVPKARQLLRCTLKLQRCIRRYNIRRKARIRKRVLNIFRRVFRRFKMMYCLWAPTFALKMLLKFMREMKKAKQVTFVIKSYMTKVKKIQAWWRIIRFPYNSRREMFKMLTRKIEAAMDAYKDETVLGCGTKGKQGSNKGKEKKIKIKKKKTSRPDTTEHVREHVDRISKCVAMHIQLVGETGKSPIPLSENELLSCFRMWMRQLVPRHQMALKRFEVETTMYQDALKKMRFKREAKTLFSAPKTNKEISDVQTTEFLSPPVRPTMKLIPSWDSVLCELETRLIIEFKKLDKW